MRKTILLIAFILILGNIFGQDSINPNTTTHPLAAPVPLGTPPGTGSISGATNVTYGQTYIYSFSGTSYPNLQWQVTNGTIISSTTTSAKVVWAGSVEMVSANTPISEDFPPIYALGGPNHQLQSYKLNTPGQTMEGSISVYSNGGLITSQIVTITIPPIHSGSISPNNQIVVEGQQPTSLSYSGATGGTGQSFSYQWQSSTDNQTWTDIPGATGLTFNPGPPTSKNTYYHVSVKQGSATETSSPASIEKILTATPPPISSVQDDNYTIDLSKPVGTPTGGINVGSDGGVQYIVPIGVLPGTNSLQPSIRLIYNSRGGVGIAAKGWSLSCFSEIKRTGKSFYFDGQTTPVAFNNTNDIFSLDGHRLFPITGTNGADGTVYGKENEDFSKIISHGGSNSTGPDWFEVTQKDGTILEYGKALNSKFPSNNATYIWLLNRVTDRNGNYCIFKYNIDPGQYAYALTEIDYTGNDAAGLQPYNKIVFSYSIKQTPTSTLQYKDGIQIETPYLLDSISVINSAGTASSRYMMSYKVQQGQYYLKTITEQGSDGSAKNPLVFKYGADNATPPVALSSSLGGLETDGSIYSGNFSGAGTDGVISAILKPDNNGQTQYLGFNMYGDLAKDPNNPVLHLDYSKNLNDSSLVYDLPTDKRGKYDALTSDYNGDGKADVLFAGFSDSSGVRKLEKIQINLTKLLPNDK